MPAFEHLPPNHKDDHETLSQFHARILAQYPETQIAPAVACLRAIMSPNDVSLMQTLRAENPDGWFARFHFSYGMQVRNYLRDKGFGEDYWPIWNLDDIYLPLIERAISPNPPRGFSCLF